MVGSSNDSVPEMALDLLMFFPVNARNPLLRSAQVVHLPSHLTTQDFVAAHWHHDRAGRRLKLPLGPMSEAVHG